MTPRKVAATVVTGFLGTGKTTLIRHLVENGDGRRLALIVNEFGDIGVDGSLLSDCCPGRVIELANGCLCCTVADEFLPAMQTLLNRADPPDHIIVETSGLALPKPLVKAFGWPDVRARVTVDGVITVVDAGAVAENRFADPPDAVSPHDNPLDEVFGDQLAMADLVLLNKTDTVAEDDLHRVTRTVESRLRPGVRVLPTRHGRLDPRIVLGLSSAAEDDLAARPTLHDLEDGHDHDDFESFAVALPVQADLGALEDRLRAAIEAHGILRLKGFLAVEGKPARHVVQAVGGRIDRYFDRPWAVGETRQSRLVVIGLKGLDRAAITALIAP